MNAAGEDSTPEQEMEIVKRHVDGLMEHFDTVQIFCTRNASGNTVSIRNGAGNWYARTGQVREWLTQEDACVQEKAIRDAFED